MHFKWNLNQIETKEIDDDLVRQTEVEMKVKSLFKKEEEEKRNTYQVKLTKKDRQSNKDEYLFLFF